MQSNIVRSKTTVPRGAEMLSLTAEQYDFIRQQEADQARFEKLKEEINSSENKLFAEDIKIAYRNYYKGLFITKFCIEKKVGLYFNDEDSDSKKLDVKNINKELKYLRDFPIKFEKPNLGMTGGNCYEINNKCLGSLVQVQDISQIQSSLLSELNLSEVSDGVKVYKDFKKNHKEMATVLTKMVEARELDIKLGRNKGLGGQELFPDSIKSSDVKLCFKEKLRFYCVLPVKYAFKNKKNKTALVVAVVLGIGMFFDAVLSGVNMTNFKSVKSFKDLIPNHLGMVAFWALALLTLSFVFKVIATGRSGMVFNEEFVRVNPEAVRVNPGIKGGNELVLGDSKAHGNPLICDADYMPR